MKDISASVLARLKNQARETGLSYQSCLQLFCQEEFLRRLSLSRYSSNFILKGGLFIYTLTEFQSRATQDIDFLMRKQSNDIENVQDIVKEICKTQTSNDYITIDVLDPNNITEDKKYSGVSIKFLGHIKQIRVPFSIDIGIDDIVVPKVIKRRIKTRLADFEEPHIYTYSLESTIAEKFDAILKRMEATSRMKDFFDIYYLSNMFDFNGYDLQTAVKQTLQHRKTIYDENSFTRIISFESNPILTAQWVRYQPLINMELPDFFTVLKGIEKFLRPIFDAIIQDDEFSMNWHAEKRNWR